MRILADTTASQPPSKRGSRVPAGVKLRGCSVVITGSTCKICGRDFKCESDVALHKRWRHLTVGTLADDDTASETCLGIIGEKCDLCDAYLESVSDLRIHKRQQHKEYRKRPRGGTVRVRFKLDGVIMTDVTLDRKYLKVQSVLQYFVNVGTQTESHENVKRQDNCAADIDSPLLPMPSRGADNIAQHGLRPHRAANRYIVSKFVSTAHSTAGTVGRSLAEISNTSHRDAISGSGANDACVEKEDPREVGSRGEDRADALIVNLVDNEIFVNIQDKENSQRINARERRNVHCQSEVSILDDSKVTPARQQDKSTHGLSQVVARKQHLGPSDSLGRASAKRPSETAKSKLSAGMPDGPLIVDAMDVDTSDNDNSLDGVRVTMKRSSAPFRLNDKQQPARVNTNADDDVQEVLRIMRGNVQNDINHESPNRTEREILVQNAINEMRNRYLFSTTRRGTNPGTEKRGSSEPTTLNGVETSDYSSLASVAEDRYEALTDKLNKKLSVCLKDLHRCGISRYNNLPEINNNLEGYALCAHDGFLTEPWMQAAGSQCITEATVNLD